MLRLKFLEHYHRVHRTSRVHIYKRPYLVPLLGLVLGLVIVGVITFPKGHSATLRPSDSHIVYLYDDGKKQTLDTKAATVGALVKRLPLNLMQQDVVEPSADTPIVQDNFRVNIYRARPVTVVDSGVKTVALTAQKSPRQAAADAGVVVYPEDYVNFAQGSVADNTIGEEVVINRATPVNFTLFGTPLVVRSHAQTVAALLRQKNITLTSADTLTPAPSTPLTPNMQINLIRDGTQVVTIQQDIATPVQYINDSSLSLGATAVRQAGSAGREAVTYQIVTQNGQQTSRTVLQTTVIQDAVPEIIARGVIVDVAANKTAAMAAAGISSGDYGYADYIISHESGWCATKAQGETYCPDYPDNSQTPNGYGLCQATPGYKMVSAGADWATNPITQLEWCSGYASSRYGGWASAYNHWVSYHNW